MARPAATTWGSGFSARALCLVTVYCTAMIYASLTTIHAWCNGWTIACYMILSLMTAALAINALDHIWRFGESGSFSAVVVVVLLAGYGIKRAYWRYIDGTHAEATPKRRPAWAGSAKSACSRDRIRS